MVALQPSSSSKPPRGLPCHRGQALFRFLFADATRPQSPASPDVGLYSKKSHLPHASVRNHGTMPWKSSACPALKKKPPTKLLRAAMSLSSPDMPPKRRVGLVCLLPVAWDRWTRGNAGLDGWDRRHWSSAIGTGLIDDTLTELRERMRRSRNRGS